MYVMSPVLLMSIHLVLAQIAVLVDATQIVVRPGEPLSKCGDASECFLAPGVHRGSLITSGSQSITGAGRDATVLLGTEQVPDDWTIWRGNIYRTRLPKRLRVDARQLFIDGQWVAEARWPNVELRTGSPADAFNGPLSTTSWAMTTNGTDLRNGQIVDPSLPRGVNWTGALATLNVGFRFLTWTRRVLDHDTSSFRYDPSDAQYGHVGGKGAYLDKADGNLYFLSGN